MAYAYRKSQMLATLLIHRRLVVGCLCNGLSRHPTHTMCFGTLLDAVL